MDPPSASAPPPEEIAVLAGGCFWCTEAVYSELAGVLSVRPGYAGGHTPNPTYEEVCTGATGHAEAVEIRFDPSQTSFAEILTVFFSTHDPTTLNRQGNDVGTQYRSAIFYRDEPQRVAARAMIDRLTAERVFRRPIVTELVGDARFFPAEEHHRNYFRRNPGQGYCQLVIAPKMAKFREKFADRLRPPPPR